MKTVSTVEDLFFDQLRDLHSMESQISISLPNLAATAGNPELQALILRHSDETARHYRTVQAIFERHGQQVGSDKCKAVEGLIAGGDSHLAIAEPVQVRDLMMIAHCLRIEHYEIAAYEITARLAERLGLEFEAQILSEHLAEEDRMAALLLEIEAKIYRSAPHSL